MWFSKVMILFQLKVCINWDRKDYSFFHYMERIPPLDEFYRRLRCFCLFWFIVDTLYQKIGNKSPINNKRDVEIED